MADGTRPFSRRTLLFGGGAAAAGLATGGLTWAQRPRTDDEDGDGDREDAAAPPRVAHSTACWARTGWLVMVSPRACASVCSRVRSALSVERIAVKRSAFHHTEVSLESEIGMP